ncbi:MAG: chemotaxis response regulator protein-glutamate methylesterase [Acidobacteriia bacterium]|nr:chemotaxis response regulator protein-glutamate methylesterase [Terriglobia bacterium]MBV8904251.1 chemotaxis response regulator protein-glutamate methylesterase [Terriglobia bacterium]
MPRGNQIRVLIVDDSAIVRRILNDALSGEPDLEVVGTAPDPYVARDKILALEPDVLTLDIEMPRMDGLTFLRKLMRYRPMPVVMISSLAQNSCKVALEAMELGAVEVLAKPGGPYSVGELRDTLAAKIRAAAASRIRPKPSGTAATSATPTPNPPYSTIASITSTSTLHPHSIIAIGASTGGTEAIANVLRVFPKDSPGVVVVQHIPSGFSRAFAHRLNDMCAIEVREAEDGDVLHPGLALVAPGDFHMLVRKSGGSYLVNVKSGPRVCYQRPSVDVLFFSVAEAAGSFATGSLLTGMGADGAQGLLKMRQAGAHTFAQDEASCVIFGMPREAIQLGAAEKVLPLDRIAPSLLAACHDLRRAPDPVASAASMPSKAGRDHTAL